MMHQRRIWIDRNFMNIKKAELDDDSDDEFMDRKSKISCRRRNDLMDIEDKISCNYNVASNGDSRINCSQYESSTNNSGLYKDKRFAVIPYYNDINEEKLSTANSVIINQRLSQDQQRSNHYLELKDPSQLPFQHDKQCQPILSFPSVSAGKSKYGKREDNKNKSSESKQTQHLSPSSSDPRGEIRIDGRGDGKDTRDSNKLQNKKSSINFSIEHILAGKIDSTSRRRTNSKTMKNDPAPIKNLNHISTDNDRDLGCVHIPVLSLPISQPSFYHNEEGRASVDESFQKCGPFDHHGLGYIYTSQGHDDYPPLFDWLNCTRYNPPKISSRCFFHYCYNREMLFAEA